MKYQYRLASVAVVLSLIACLVGCAFVKSVVGNDPVAAICKVLNIATPFAVDQILNATANSPAQRAVFVTKINAVAKTLDALATAGKVDPDTITQTFKINEPWADSVLSGISTTWSLCYGQIMGAGGSVTDVVRAAKCLADDVLAATSVSSTSLRSGTTGAFVPPAPTKTTIILRRALDGWRADTYADGALVKTSAAPSQTSIGALVAAMPPNTLASIVVDPKDPEYRNFRR